MYCTTLKRKRVGVSNYILSVSTGNTDISIYRFFTEEDIILDNGKLLASKELHMENKSVAYIAYNGNIIAVVGYLA